MLKNIIVIFQLSLTSLLTGDLLSCDLSFRSLLNELLLLLLLFLHDSLLLLLLRLRFLKLLSLHLGSRNSIIVSRLAKLWPTIWLSSKLLINLRNIWKDLLSSLSMLFGHLRFNKQTLDAQRRIWSKSLALISLYSAKRAVLLVTAAQFNQSAESSHHQKFCPRDSLNQDVGRMRIGRVTTWRSAKA